MLTRTKTRLRSKRAGSRAERAPFGNSTSTRRLRGMSSWASSAELPSRTPRRR